MQDLRDGKRSFGITDSEIEELSIPLHGGGEVKPSPRVLQRIQERKQHKPTDVSLFYWMLYYPMRDFVITDVKDPIRKALEAGESLSEIMKVVGRSVGLLPKITKENTISHNVHILIDKKEKLLSFHHNGGREKMVEAALNLDIAEYEHDIYYSFLQDWLLIELAMEIATGNWHIAGRPFPIPQCWSGGDLPDLETVRQKMREALNG